MKKEIMGKCPNCGEIIDLTEAKKQSTCPKCSTVFEVKDAVSIFEIQQKTQKNNENREKNTVILKDENELLEKAEYQLSLNNYASAMAIYEEILEQNSTNANAWFGLVKCQTKRFTDYNEDTHEEELYKALTFASPEDKVNMLKIYDNYVNAKEIYLQKRNELNQTRMDILKPARTKTLNQDLEKLNNNFYSKHKVETIKIISLSIIFAVLFLISVLFGMITVFTSSWQIGAKILAFFGVLALLFAMGYYLYICYQFLNQSQILFKQIIAQEELVDNLAKTINKTNYTTVEILIKMHNKGFIPGFSLYEKKYLLYYINSVNATSSQKQQNIKVKNKKLDKIDKILYKDKK